LLFIGTSGYSYEDWLGEFYPKDLPKNEMLSYYSQYFNSVEINFTYYKIPNRFTLINMAKKVGDDFSFSIKASGLLTHERTENQSDFANFIEAIKPLIDVGKLACVLAQFPWSFHPSMENYDYLKMFRDKFMDIPIVYEFRNSQWISNETFNFLKENGIGFCCVDEPNLKGLLPPVAVATSDITYVRFHGRNKDNWWKHTQAYERYDYLYSNQELLEWVPKIKELETSSKKTFLYFNNHFKAKAVNSAQLLINLIHPVHPQSAHPQSENP
jgi:uncharacterized protein YecE (DUF72 family)